MPRRKKVSVEGMPSEGYGAQAQRERDTAVVPMAPPADPMAGLVGPDDVPSLADPSMRPDEPLTAGLPSGPGGGPEILGPVMESDPVRRTLQAMMQAYPSNDVMRLIDMLDIQGR